MEISDFFRDFIEAPDIRMDKSRGKFKFRSQIEEPDSRILDYFAGETRDLALLIANSIEIVSVSLNAARVYFDKLIHLSLCPRV